MSEVMLPAGTARLASSTAFRPPKLMDTWRASSISSGPREAPQQSGDAARQKRHHRDQHRSVDHQAHTGCVAHQIAGELAEQLQRRGAEERAENRAQPADDRAEQRLDGHRGSVGDMGIDVVEILHVERPPAAISPAEITIAWSFTRNTSTPSAAAESSLSRTAVSHAPLRERSSHQES